MAHKAVSGAELLLILDYTKEIKAIEFEVQTDANGFITKILNSLIHDLLIDYVALDYKSLPHTFKKITQSGLFFEFTFLWLKNNIPFHNFFVPSIFLIKTNLPTHLRNYHFLQLKLYFQALIPNKAKASDNIPLSEKHVKA